MYQKYWWYDLQLLRYRVWQTEISSYGSFFVLILPRKTPKILKKNWKKIASDIILHMCTKNCNHVRYSSWDTEWDRPSFALWTPNNPENQNLGKMKKPSGDVVILLICTKNHDHMMYNSWDMECNRHNFLSFWAIFLPLYPTIDPKN